jgi:hypothetical protein
MSLHPTGSEFPTVGTTELDWSARARGDGWVLSKGQWQHDDRVESYDDGDWIYVGNGGGDDAYLGSLPLDVRCEVMRKYTDLLSAPS